MCVIETKNLVKTYKSGKLCITAIDDISLKIRKGSIIFIKGRSGSGKTTLLNLIGCLDYPTQGSVLLNGQVVSSLPEGMLSHIRRNHIGFVFQRFYLLPTLNAINNVMLPLKYSRVSKKEARRRSLDLLDAIDMRNRSEHYPDELSGGEQQRIAIARALANSPSVVLADEPTGDLDSHTAGSVFSLIKTLNKTFRQTFVVVSHDESIMDCADKIIQLEDGKIINDTEEISTELP